MKLSPAVAATGATVLAAALASCTGSDSSHVRKPGTASPSGSSSTHVGTTAAALCQRVDNGSMLVSVKATTVGKARRTDVGGPASVRPGAHAFPGVSAGQRAAWCWIENATPSPPDAVDYTAYVVTAGQPPLRFFRMGFDRRLSRPPRGAPIVP
jgi:hypothetical protein